MGIDLQICYWFVTRYILCQNPKKCNHQDPQTSALFLSWILVWFRKKTCCHTPGTAKKQTELLLPTWRGLEMETLSPDNPVARQRMREHLRVKQIAKQRKFRHEGLVEFYRVLLLQTPSRLIQDNTEHLLYATTFLYESSSFIKRDFPMLSLWAFSQIASKEGTVTLQGGQGCRISRCCPGTCGRWIWNDLKLFGFMVWTCFDFSFDL